MTHILIPGLLSDGAVWRALADRLGAPAKVADMTRDGSIEAMARRVLQDSEGEIVAIGHSMGGRVAMEIARQAPERVRGLVLSNTGHNGGTEAELPKRHARIALGHKDMSELAADWLPGMVAPRNRDDFALMDGLRQMVLRHDADIHERQIHALIGRPDASTYLPSINCPILLLVGDEDAWSPIRQHEEIQRMAPDASLEVIEGAGHFLPLERPDPTAAAITRWLTEKGLSNV